MSEAQSANTVEILVGHKRSGEPVREEVPAEPAGGRIFRLTGSPGLAQGAAAGDTIDVRPDGSFEVLERGGNLAVQVLADRFDEPAMKELEAAVRMLGGRLDGGHDRLRVYTVPVSAGFPAIERVFVDFVARHGDAAWYFGNVYDPVDGVTPLGWWED